MIDKLLKQADKIIAAINKEVKVINQDTQRLESKQLSLIIMIDDNNTKARRGERLAAKLQELADVD